MVNFDHDKKNHIRALGIDANTEERIIEIIRDSISNLGDLSKISLIIEQILSNIKRNEFGDEATNLTAYEVKLFVAGLLFNENIKDRSFDLMLKALFNELGGSNEE